MAYLAQHHQNQLLEESHPSHTVIRPILEVKQKILTKRRLEFKKGRARFEYSEILGVCI